MAIVIIIGGSSAKTELSRNEDLVRSYINARNSYDIEKINTLIEDNYHETFIDGTVELETKAQLIERILWGKELDSKIELLEIKSDDKNVITIEEYSNYLDVALNRKSRKFKIVYTIRDHKIQHQKIDTVPGYSELMRFNWDRYMAFEAYCQQNNLALHNLSSNRESGIQLRQILEKYKDSREEQE